MSCQKRYVWALCVISLHGYVWWVTCIVIRVNDILSPTHGVCFAGASLAIGEDSGVVASHGSIQQLCDATDLQHIWLFGVGCQAAVECKVTGHDWPLGPWCHDLHSKGMVLRFEVMWGLRLELWDLRWFERVGHSLRSRTASTCVWDHTFSACMTAGGWVVSRHGMYESTCLIYMFYYRYIIFNYIYLLIIYKYIYNTDILSYSCTYYSIIVYI